MAKVATEAAPPGILFVPAAPALMKKPVSGCPKKNAAAEKRENALVMMVKPTEQPITNSAALVTIDLKPYEKCFTERI